MKIAIHQPNFLPWVGYFHKINIVDIFVFLDDVQFERGKTFTSRSKILVQGQEKWLTVPVTNRSDMTLIKDARVDESFIWKKKHLRTIEVNYNNHPFLHEVYSIIENMYRSTSTFLIDYNIPLIIDIAKYLKIKTEFLISSQLHNTSNLIGGEKILGICKELKAAQYLSGTGSGSIRYIKEDDFKKSGIELKWQNFTAGNYHQINNGKFIPGLSIIDLLLNHGRNSVKYING